MSDAGLYAAALPESTTKTSVAVRARCGGGKAASNIVDGVEARQVRVPGSKSANWAGTGGPPSAGWLATTARSLPVHTASPTDVMPGRLSAGMGVQVSDAGS